MTDTNSVPESHTIQLQSLTLAVSKHDELFQSLKDVPAMLKSLMGSQASEGEVLPNLSDEESHNSDNEDVDNILQNSNASLDNDPELAEAFKDVDGDIEIGPAINPQVSECIDKAVYRTMKKEAFSKLVADYKVPANCKAIQVPKMNPEIWSHLPTKARVADLSLQQLQQYTSLGLIALANIADFIAKNKDGMSKDLPRPMIEMVKNAANVLGHGHQSLSFKRRTEVKPFLNSEFAGICGASTPVTDFLFGDDLKESLKSSKAAAAVVRQSFAKRKSFRSRPYQVPQNGPGSSQGRPLNWNRPFPQRQWNRGGWKSASQSRAQQQPFPQKRNYQGHQ